MSQKSLHTKQKNQASCSRTVVYAKKKVLREIVVWPRAISSSENILKKCVGDGGRWWWGNMRSNNGKILCDEKKALVLISHVGLAGWDGWSGKKNIFTSLGLAYLPPPPPPHFQTLVTGGDRCIQYSGTKKIKKKHLKRFGGGKEVLSHFVVV